MSFALITEEVTEDSVGARDGCERLWLCSESWLNAVTGGRRQNG